MGTPTMSSFGQFGRNRTRVWAHAGGQLFCSKQATEGNLLALHPTVKPVAMVGDAMLDCSARGDIVLDSFLGSGTSIDRCRAHWPALLWHRDRPSLC